MVNRVWLKTFRRKRPIVHSCDRVLEMDMDSWWRSTGPVHTRTHTPTHAHMYTHICIKRYGSEVVWKLKERGNIKSIENKPANKGRRVLVDMEMPIAALTFTSKQTWDATKEGSSDACCCSYIVLNNFHYIVPRISTQQHIITHYRNGITLHLNWAPWEPLTSSKEYCYLQQTIRWKRHSQPLRHPISSNTAIKHCS